MKTCNSILLIDDSDSDNFLHTRILKKTGVTDKIIVKNNGVTALEYLKEQIAMDSNDPELIFLDINMPGMNGWEFLDEYDKLDEKSKERIIICMLTTSYATPDIEKAKSNNCIHSFISKPLTTKKLLTVLENIE